MIHETVLCILQIKNLKVSCIFRIYKRQQMSDHKKQNHNNYTRLCLSAGSVKGIAMTGALHEMYLQNKLKDICIYVGTSVGSIICYLLILGYSPLEIMTYTCTHNMGIEFDIKNVNIFSFISSHGIFAYENIEKHLKTLTLAKLSTIPTLVDIYQNQHKDFRCVVYNLTLKRTEYLSYKSHPNLSCLDAIHLSASIPVVFEKYSMNKQIYVDGALLECFAIEYTDRLISHLDKKYTRTLGIATVSQPKRANPDLFDNTNSSRTSSDHSSHSNNFNHLNLNMLEPTKEDVIQDSCKQLFSFLTDLLSVWQQENLRTALKYKSNNLDVMQIKISSEQAHPLEFCLSSKDKIKLFSVGCNHAKQWAIDPKQLKHKLD